MGGLIESNLVRIPPNSDQRLHNISHESCCLHYRSAHILSQIWFTSFYLFLSSSEILNPLPNCMIFAATILALSSVGCVLLISVLCELIGRHSNRTGRHWTIIKRFSFIITQQVYYINNRNIYTIKKDAKYSIFHDLTL